MKTLITSTYFALFCLFNANLSYAQCDFTKVNSPDCGYATFLLDSDGNAYSDRLDFGDNTSQSVLGLSVVNHYYSSPGNYTVKRTYRSEFGSICRSTESITIAPCCPQITDITVLPINNENLTSTCVSGLTSGNNDSTLESLIAVCYFKFTPILNTNNTNFNTKWRIVQKNPNSTFQLCELSNAFSLKSRLVLPPINNGTTYDIIFYISSSTCQEISVTKNLKFYSGSCSDFTFSLRGDNNEKDEFFLKNSNSKNNVLIYPNPTKDKVNINIQDNETHSFDIYNTLGQSLLSQKINSESSSVDLSNLNSGVYIGVLKSKDKIIHTEKIYKN